MKESMEEFEIALADCNTMPEYLSKAISATKQYPDKPIMRKNRVSASWQQHK